MSMPRYVALLRGINVGGNNLIKMTALKACFEEQGFADVVTYIQSGNVLFDARASGAAKLARRHRGGARRDVQLQGEHRPAVGESSCGRSSSARRRASARSRPSTATTSSS